MPRGRTSTAAAQANAVMRPHPDCSEARRRLVARLPHGHEQCARTTGRGPQAPRSYGRYLVALYNAERPHSSWVGKRRWPSRQPDSIRARNGTGRSRDLRASRPVPLRRAPKTNSITQRLWSPMNESRGAPQVVYRGTPDATRRVKQLQAVRGHFVRHRAQAKDAITPPFRACRFARSRRSPRAASRE